MSHTGDLLMNFNIHCTRLQSLALLIVDPTIAELYYYYYYYLIYHKERFAPKGQSLHRGASLQVQLYVQYIYSYIYMVQKEQGATYLHSTNNYLKRSNNLQHTTETKYKTHINEN